MSELYGLQDTNFNYYHYQPFKNIIIVYCKHITHARYRPRYKDEPSSGRAVIPTVENQGLSVLQLNAEGLTNAKLAVIRQLADSNQVAVVLLQETHRTTDDNLKLPGFLLAGSIPSKHHGLSTFVRTGITWSAVKRSPSDSNIEWLVTEVQ